MKKWVVVFVLIFLVGCTRIQPQELSASQEPHAQDTPQPPESQELQVQNGPQPYPPPVTSIRPGFTSLPVMRHLGELPGGHISDIQFSASNPNILYLASNVNAMGVWKSTDTGETWQRIYYDDNFGGTHVNSVAIDQKNPDVVFATDVHGRVSKGVKGEFKELKDLKVALFGLALDSTDSRTVYVGTEKGKLWKSSDEGKTWSELYSFGDAIGPIVVEKETIYVGTREHGLFVSHDFGKTWTNEYKDGEVMKIAKRGDTLFLATQSGLLRKTSGEFEPVMKRNTRTVVIAPSNPLIVYAGTADDGVYKSVDGGTTWTKLSDGIENPDVGALAVHPTNPDVVLTGTNIWQWSFHGETFPSSTLGEGIYKTTDGGRNWKKIEGNFYDLDVDTIAVDPHNYNNIYIGTECSRGIYRSLDGGQLFEFISGGPEGPTGSFDIAHYTMRIVTDNNSNVFLTGRFGITKSNDFGKTWSVTGVRRHYHGVAVSPHDSKLVISGTSPEYFDPAMGPDNVELPGAQIVRSEDGGVTWQLSQEGFPAGTHTSLHDVAFDANDPNVVYATTTHEEIGLPPTDKTLGIYKSTDKGKSWHAVNTGLTSLDVDTVAVSPHKKIFAGTMNGVFISDDGENWSSTSLKHEVESILIDPLGTVFVGTTEDGLFASFDDGATWQEVDGVPHQKVSGLAYSQGYLFAAINDAGVFRSD